MQTAPHHGKGSAGQQERIESPNLRGKPANSPERENIYPEKKSSAKPPEQVRQRPEHGMAAGPEPDKLSGYGAYKRADPAEKRPVYRRPAGAGTSAEVPDGRPASMEGVGTKEAADRRPSLRTVAGHESGSNVAWGTEPSRPISDARSVGLRGEEPFSARQPDQGDVRTFPAENQPVRDALPAAPGGKQRPVGDQAQLASGTPFGSTELLFNPLWDERGSLIPVAQEALRSVPGGSHDLFERTLYRGNLTQRGPPLEVPSPFFGFISMMAGAASGFSGSGVAPLLLAVIAPCLIAVLYRGRSRIFHTFLRPVAVPRPGLERPG